MAMARKPSTYLFDELAFPSTRDCSKCGKNLPAERFHRDGAGGLRSGCKECVAQYQAELARRRRSASEPHLTPPPARKCVGCGESKAPSEFGPHPTGRGGLRRRCRACYAEVERKRREASACLGSSESATISSGKKLCRKCGKLLPLSRFGSDRRAPSKVSASCRKCVNRYFGDWRLRGNQERWRLKRYGLTEESHGSLLAAQGGVCAICGAAPKPGSVLAIDHDHKTGEVRGLLCLPCNSGIGYLGDSADRLAAASQYLKSPPAAALPSIRRQAAS